jgi:hypothetical protein
MAMTMQTKKADKLFNVYLNKGLFSEPFRDMLLSYYFAEESKDYQKKFLELKELLSLELFLSEKFHQFILDTIYEVYQVRQPGFFTKKKKKELK